MGSLAEVATNNVVQGLDILLSIIRLIALVAFAAVEGGALNVTASAVFGASVIILYAVSTLNHAIPEQAAPRMLSLLDTSPSIF